MPPSSDRQEAVLKIVDCPQCGGVSHYTPNNRFRPFCSERCKQLDLGAWASENFKLPEQGITPNPDFEHS